MIKTLKAVLFFFSNLLFYSSFIFAMENTEKYEGWTWSPTLKITLPDSSEIDLEDSHRAMKSIVETDKSISGYAKKKDMETKKNVVLLRLGFLVKKDNAYQYRETDCFKKMIFFSESEVDKKTKKDPLGINKFGENFYKIDPIGYSFKPVDIQNELESRFSLQDINYTLIDPTIYEKSSFQFFKNPKLLSEDFADEVKNKKNSKAISLDNAINRFQNTVFYLQDRHAHSEPKILFFLNKTITSIPPYWSFQFEPALNEAIERVKDFILINNNLFADEYVSTTLEDLQEEVLNMSVRADIRNRLRDTKTNIEKNEEINKEEKIKKARLDAEQKVEKLGTILSNLEEIEIRNPLKLKISDPNSFKPQAYEALEKLKDLLGKKPYERLKDIKKDDDEITELESLLPYQDQENTTEQNWIARLVSSLSSLEEDEEVTEVILNWYSYYDICESCCPSIARECERKDGFLVHLRSIVMASNPVKSLSPISLRVLTSCSIIREQCKERFDSVTFKNINMTYQPLFTQTFLQ